MGANVLSELDFREGFDWPGTRKKISERLEKGRISREEADRLNDLLDREVMEDVGKSFAFLMISGVPGSFMPGPGTALNSLIRVKYMSRKARDEDSVYGWGTAIASAFPLGSYASLWPAVGESPWLTCQLIREGLDVARDKAKETDLREVSGRVYDSLEKIAEKFGYGDEMREYTERFKGRFYRYG